MTHKYSARELAEVLLREHDILVKDCSLKRGMYGKQYIRIAIRSKEENRYLAGILNINYEYRYKGGTSEDALFIAVFRYCLQEARY